MWNRRHWMQVAAGCGLSFCVPGMESRAMMRRGAERKKSLITVWLEGGASQLETWDPHPNTAIGGPTKSIATSIPDVQIAADYPRIAEQLHRLSLIRSLVSKEGDHTRAAYVVKTGFRPDPTLRHPALGSIISHELPSPELEIPAFISLGYDPRPSRGGYLGSRHDALQVRDVGGGAQRMQSAFLDERQKTRLENLSVVTSAFARKRQAAVEQTLFQHTLDAALRMMTSEQLKAFQIADEPADLLAKYGDSGFGRACLIARRLIEQGVRAIDITLQNFDTHDDNFSRHKAKAAELDPGLATLVDDLAARDLLDSTVVLCLSEFGRTPRINENEGRDHWPTGFSCLVGGGGLASGVVLGSTDPTGKEKDPQDPVPIADLCATVLSTLGVEYAKENSTPIGRPMKFSDGQPLARLIASGT